MRRYALYRVPILVCWCSILVHCVAQAEKMRAQLAALPPLHVTKLPSRDGGRREVLSSALYRKTDQLLETLLQMSANVKVVDITGKSPGARVFYCYNLIYIDMFHETYYNFSTYCTTICFMTYNFYDLFDFFM